MSENIRVSVQWKKNAVFAGEPLECTITFRNVSEPFRRKPSPHPRSNGLLRDRLKDKYSSRPDRKASQNSHRASHSTSTLPVAPSLGSNGLVESTHPVAVATNGNGSLPDKDSQASHRRSVSIVSLGSDIIDEAAPRKIQRSRPAYSHGRAASLQVLPRGSEPFFSASKTASQIDRSFTVPSPPKRHASYIQESGNLLREPVITATTRNSSGARPIRPGPIRTTGFTFPDQADGSRQNGLDTKRSPLSARAATPPRLHSPLTLEAHATAGHQDNASAIATESYTETPRSSGDFYSVSNHSSESLASEYVSTEAVNFLRRPAHSRQSSSLGPFRNTQSETLLIGYGQLAGSFVLDGSLVNQSPFEEVKRKRIVGGQGGGGLVRSQSTKRDSGILSSFGWGNIGQKFNGFLGEGGASSMKDAKKLMSTKSIPILSVPQSVLFVDLRLSPGESRSYNFSHTLPPGIPPSYRGKAIKITYNLVIGAQHAGAAGQQNQVRSVEIPFRVLPGVNEQGNILGHDLMAPHTLLSNRAIITEAENAQDSGPPSHLSAQDVAAHPASPSQSDGLASYVNELLHKPRRTSKTTLLSPSEEETRQLSIPHSQPLKMEQIIDFAILTNGLRHPTNNKSTNRFEINRNGTRVAQIMLSRTAYRLGETLTAVVDFAKREIPCYALYTSLESVERIDSSLALRSKASVQRVTRRVHAASYESTISARRVLFSATVPLNATPEFITTGINLEWYLRIEFATFQNDESDESQFDDQGLLEEVSLDDRGKTSAAVQGLHSETFDVNVPLHIYGASSLSEDNLTSAENII